MYVGAPFGFSAPNLLRNLGTRPSFAFRASKGLAASSTSTLVAFSCAVRRDRLDGSEAGHAGQFFFKLSLSIQGSSWIVFGCTPFSFGLAGGLVGTVNSLTPRAPEGIWAKTVTNSITRSPTGKRTLPFLATKASKGMDKVCPAGIPLGSLEKNCSFNSMDRLFQAASVVFLMVMHGTNRGDSSGLFGEIHIVSKRTRASNGGSGILPV